MGAFQQGFALGADIYNNAQKQKLIQEQAERDRLKFEREQKGWRDEDAFREALSQAYKDKNWTGGVDIDEAVTRGLNFDSDAIGAGANQGIDVSGSNFQKALNDPTLKVSFSPDEQRAALISRLKELTPAQQQAALRAYGMSPMAAQSEGALNLRDIGVYRDESGQVRATNEGTKRTADQASAALLQQMQESGNAYGIEQANKMRKGALDLQKGELELKGAQRGERYAQAEEEYSAWLQTQMQELNEDPVAWAQKNLAAYNKPKKGSRLDDGMTAEIVKGMDANGQPVYSFVQRDKDGKGIFAAPVNQQTAMQALQELAFDKYMSLPGKFKEAKDMQNKDRQVSAQERTAGATERNAATQEKYYTEIYPDQQDKNRRSNEKVAGMRAAGGGAKQRTMRENVNEYAELLVESQAINPKTNKPYTAAEAKQYALGVALKDPNSKQQGYDKETLREMGIIQSPDGRFFRQGNVKKGEPEWVETKLPGQKSALETAMAADAQSGSNPFAPKGDSKPAPARQQPAQALPLTERLTKATGNAYEMQQLATEAETRLPAIGQQIAALEQAAKGANPQQRAAVDAQIARLKMDAQIYEGVLMQRKAQRGY